MQKRIPSRYSHYTLPLFKNIKHQHAKLRDRVNKLEQMHKAANTRLSKARAANKKLRVEKADVETQLRSAKREQALGASISRKVNRVSTKSPATVAVSFVVVVVVVAAAVFPFSR